MSVQAQIVDLLRDRQERHRLAYMFISHDLKVVRALSDEVIVMRNGKVVEQGSADRIFEDPQAEYTKALLKAAFELEAVEGDVVATCRIRRRQHRDHRRTAARRPCPVLPAVLPSAPTPTSDRFISHDLKVVRALSDEVIVMRNGKVVEQGSADRIF